MATLTTVYGDNNTLQSNIPVEKVDVKENYGRVRVLYDKYTQDAADAFGTSGLIKMMTIPKGARVVGGSVTCPATGATGIFEVGWAASAESGAEASDADGLFTSQDPGAAAVGAHMSPLVPGWNKTFSEAVEVQVDWTEAQADVGTGIVELMLLIVVD